MNKPPEGVGTAGGLITPFNPPQRSIERYK